MEDDEKLDQRPFNSRNQENQPLGYKEDGGWWEARSKTFDSRNQENQPLGFYSKYHQQINKSRGIYIKIW